MGSSHCFQQAAAQGPPACVKSGGITTATTNTASSWPRQPQRGGGVTPDATMAASHLVAAVVSYTLLRRGELILHALTGLLSIRPVLLLCDSGPAVPVRAPQSLPVRPLPAWHVWISAGPRTLRGPPLTAS